MMKSCIIEESDGDLTGHGERKGMVDVRYYDDLNSQEL